MAAKVPLVRVPSHNQAPRSWYTAIGASDAIGFGSSVPCLPLTDCPQGRGYVQVATRDLRAQGFTVNLTNLGFPAMVLSRRIEDLGNIRPRFHHGKFHRPAGTVRDAHHDARHDLCRSESTWTRSSRHSARGAGGSDRDGLHQQSGAGIRAGICVADPARPRQGVRRPGRGSEPAEHGGHAEKRQCPRSTAPGRTAVVGRHRHSSHQPSGGGRRGHRQSDVRRARVSRHRRIRATAFTRATRLSSRGSLRKWSPGDDDRPPSACVELSGR